MSDLTFWDDTPDVEAPENYTGPRWQKVPCAICGEERIVAVIYGKQDHIV